MKKLSLSTIAMLMLLLLCITCCSESKSYDVKITIPANSTEAFVYSQEEILPSGYSITLSCGEGLSDSEVVLKPVNAIEGSYLPAYLTPGTPVKMDATKGEWFHLGVSMQNPTSEDIVVYVRAEKLELS